MFTCKVQQMPSVPCDEGLSRSFLRLRCCRQDPKVLVTELPIMQCIPIEASKLKLQNTFRTPVYVTQVCARLEVEDALPLK